MSILENVCPVCKTRNELEAVVCSHCGAALDDPFLDPGARTKTSDMPALTPDAIRGWTIDRTAVPDRGIAVYIEGQTRPTCVDLREEFVLGRRVGSTSESLLDLSPYGAYHLGLSRRHAVIRRTEGGYEVLDLGSVNGTWLNEERLTPHKFYSLTSGSHLRLGRMRLVVLYGPAAVKR